MADRESEGPLGTAREEAERLIAAALAAASFAARQGRRVTGARDAKARADRERADREGRPRSAGGPDLAGLAGLAGRFLSDWGKDAERDDSSPFSAKSGADRYDLSGRDFTGDQPDHGRWRIATGSEACCMCPICRAIDAVRDPSPELMEKIASGASDLAAAATTILRTVGDVTNRIRRPAEEGPHATPVEDRPADDWTDTLTVVIQRDEPADGPAFAEGADFSSVWQSATRAPTTEPPRRAPHTPKPMAKKVVRGPASPPSAAAESGADDSEPALRPATAAKETGRGSATEPSVKAGRSVSAGKAVKAGRAVPAGKAVKAGRAVPAGKAVKAGRVAKATGRGGAAEPSGKTGRSVPAGKAVKAGKAGKAAKAAKAAKTARPSEAAKAGKTARPAKKATGGTTVAKKTTAAKKATATKKTTVAKAEGAKSGGRTTTAGKVARTKKASANAGARRTATKSAAATKSAGAKAAKRAAGGGLTAKR